MSAKTFSAALVGIEAVPIEVEAEISNSLAKFVVVGLPDKAVQEARERVRAALHSSGLPYPDSMLTVNLAPADIRKEGAAYDVAIAVATLVAQGALPTTQSRVRRLLLGELALDGSLRPINGALPSALMAVEQGFDELYLPEANAAEAALVRDEHLKIYAVPSLWHLAGHLDGTAPLRPFVPPPRSTEIESTEPHEFDFIFIKGQLQARRALEIAAAGGHNILFSGPPGSGKTLLARSLPTILPEMTWGETLEVTKIFSVAGLASHGRIVEKRPFRAPHHTASGIALIGGGTTPRPGEVSLAHRGVLFLDELPEFSRSVLENLRQPLEDGSVTISRAQGTLRFPAKFMLVAAQNPCPCGYADDPGRTCRCAPQQILKYRKRVSGPLLDRIDIHVSVPRAEYAELFADAPAEPSTVIRGRVQTARNRQVQRLSGSGIFTNAEMGQKLSKRHCHLEPAAENILREAAERLKLSARAVSRTIKVARTIADLAGQDDIAVQHIAEALQFRVVKE